MVVNSWTMILEVFSNLNHSMVFQWVSCIKIRTEIAKPIFFLTTLLLWNLPWRFYCSVFSLEGRIKHLMPYIQAFLFSCWKCSHSDKWGFNLQAWHRMKFHRVIRFHALLNLESDFSVAKQGKPEVQESGAGSAGEDMSIVVSKSSVVKWWKRLSGIDH